MSDSLLFLFTGISLWHIDSHLSPVSSHSLASERVHVLISSSYKNTSYVGLRPTQVTSFYFNHLFQGPLQLQSHSKVLGIRTANYDFWGTQFSTSPSFLSPHP